MRQSLVHAPVRCWGPRPCSPRALTWLPRRWLGEVRFQLGGVWETLWARNYRCRLYVLPPEVAEGMAAAEVEKAAAAGKDGKAGGGVRTQSMLDNGDECSSGGGGGGGDGSCGGGSSSSTGIDNRSGSNGGGGGGDGGRQLLEGCPPPGLERSKSSQLLDYPDGACTADAPAQPASVGDIRWPTALPAERVC